MAVQSHYVQGHLPLIETCQPSCCFSGIPVIDTKDTQAKAQVVEACQNFGFFKLVNHGVPMSFATRLEDEGVKFFRLPRSDKDLVGPPQPSGYGNKTIGPNGDVSWIEYLLLSTNLDSISQISASICPENPENFSKHGCSDIGIMQVMSNGKFRSVKHRVLTEGNKARVSMIYFGGPPLTEIVAPLPPLVKEGEESLHKDFTWAEYKKSAGKTRLADYRLGLFEKKESE